MNLQNVQMDIKQKESGVKSEIERIWAEWQQKQEFLEADLDQAQKEVTALELNKKVTSKEL